MHAFARIGWRESATATTYTTDSAGTAPLEETRNARELASNRSQQRGIAGELEHPGLIAFETGGHQLRQSRGREHARSDPADKGVARAGDDGHAGPQGVAGGRVRIV